MTPKLTLIGGGVRCGKSAFALDLARARGERRTFFATAEAYDDEMRARAIAHREERGTAFQTIEEPVDVLARFAEVPDGDVVVLDCLTLWISNLLLRDFDETAILTAVEAFATAAMKRSGSTIIVTNEVGMGVVPESALGRRFRDISGRSHQILAARADEVFVAIMGLRLRVKPGPVDVVGLS